MGRKVWRRVKEPSLLTYTLTEFIPLLGNFQDEDIRDDEDRIPTPQEITQGDARNQLLGQALHSAVDNHALNPYPESDIRSRWEPHWTRHLRTARVPLGSTVLDRYLAFGFEWGPKHLAKYFEATRDKPLDHDRHEVSLENVDILIPANKKGVFKKAGMRMSVRIDQIRPDPTRFRREVLTDLKFHRCSKQEFMCRWAPLYRLKMEVSAVIYMNWQRMTSGGRGVRSIPRLVNWNVPCGAVDQWDPTVERLAELTGRLIRAEARYRPTKIQELERKGLAPVFAESNQFDVFEEPP